LFRATYESTQGLDGYVSLEVSPHLAHDTEATIAEAVRLRGAVDRPNAMIKIPATPAGLPAITAVIGQGINVNVTLLFAVSSFEKVAQAYMAGLERRLSAGHSIKNIASVASFFVSRIDTLVDELLTKPGVPDEGRSLLGQLAVANAYIAWEKYLQLQGSPGWKKLAEFGARPQRLLWASTSTKNPAYPKTKYVDSLLAANTVNTIPPETVRAIMEAPVQKLEPFTARWDQNLAWARKTLSALAQTGISLDAVTEQLLQEAVKKFADPFDQLLRTLEEKAKALQTA
jgi:transaldolase